MILRSIHILLWLALIGTSVSIFAQPKANTRKQILLDREKAPVYIEFVRIGKCAKDLSNYNFGNLCNAKSDYSRTFEVAWLRLVNNTRWSIGVTVEKGATEKNSVPIIIKSTSTINQIGERVAIGKDLANDGAEMDVVYKAESETGCDFHKEAPKGQVCFRRETKIPEIPLPGISRDLFVSSGKSIIFPIDRNHITEYINLYVLYNFEWEYSGAHFSRTPQYDLQHRVYFGWFDLENGIKTSKRKSK